MPALRHLRNHLQGNITSAQQQEICHLSGTHFKRLSHSAMGCSPLEDIWNLRISNACDHAKHPSVRRWHSAKVC